MTRSSLQIIIDIFEAKLRLLPSYGPFCTDSEDLGNPGIPSTCRHSPAVALYAEAVWERLRTPQLEANLRGTFSKAGRYVDLSRKGAPGSAHMLRGMQVVIRRRRDGNLPRCNSL